jgi:hypothetical protein
VIAALIAGVSTVALFPLFVSYCGSALAAARKVELSDRVSALADVHAQSVSADDFDRILQLVRLCPEYDADRSGVRAIAAYYRTIQALNGVFGALSPGLAAWTARERLNCSHFAAVVLDRCISSSRSLFTQQATDRL